MAIKKAEVNAKLIQEFAKNPPKNPVPTKADMVFLKGLKRRGYVDSEIIEIAKKADFIISQEDLKIQSRVKKQA